MGVSKNEFVCQEISKSPKGKVIVNGPVGKLIPKMVKKKKKSNFPLAKEEMHFHSPSSKIVLLTLIKAMAFYT